MLINKPCGEDVCSRPYGDGGNFFSLAGRNSLGKYVIQVMKFLINTSVLKLLMIQLGRDMVTGRAKRQSQEQEAELILSYQF